MPDIVPAAPGYQGVTDLTALAGALSRAQAERRDVTIVYAPTTITHTHHAALPVPRPFGSAGSAGVGTGAGHPGIDVDASGYAPPADVAPLPAVAETRSLAPLAFLFSAWSFVGAACAAALTDGNPGSIAALVVSFAATGASGVALYRTQS